MLNCSTIQKHLAGIITVIVWDIRVQGRDIRSNEKSKVWKIRGKCYNEVIRNVLEVRWEFIYMWTEV